MSEGRGRGGGREETILARSDFTGAFLFTRRTYSELTRIIKNTWKRLQVPEVHSARGPHLGVQGTGPRVAEKDGVEGSMRTPQGETQRLGWAVRFLLVLCTFLTAPPLPAPDPPSNFPRVCKAVKLQHAAAVRCANGVAGGDGLGESSEEGDGGGRHHVIFWNAASWLLYFDMAVN